MDDWMPWKITRNFIRAFFPTLVLVICWDLWHNVDRAAPGRRLAILADLAAFAVVLAMRLSPPLTAARDQLMYLLRCAREGAFMLALLLAPFIFHKISAATLREDLMLAVSYAFCADMARICRVSMSDTERGLRAIYGLIGCIAYFFYNAAALAVKSWPGNGEWMDLIDDMTTILIMLAIFVLLGWWKQRRGPEPVVQELGLMKSP